MVVESSDSSLFLKRNLRLRSPQPLFVAEPPEGRIKQLLIQRRGPMLVGIRQRGFIRRHADSEMNQLAQTTGQPVADLAQRVRVSQLAEQHRDQLRPATEAFGCSFGTVLLHQRRELKAREMLQQLIKQAHCLYHSFCPPVGDSAAEPLGQKMARRWNNYRGACFLLSSAYDCCLGQE